MKACLGKFLRKVVRALNGDGVAWPTGCVVDLVVAVVASMIGEWWKVLIG